VPQKYLKLAVILLAIILRKEVFAQQFESVKDVEEKGILYNRIHTFGLTVHSGGLGINYRPGKNLSGYSFLMGDFQLINMRHPKEVRSVNPFSDNNSGYIYGKLNAVFIARTGIGIRKTLNPKEGKGGVELSWSGFAGASWGLSKPVFLTIYQFDDQNGLSESIEKYNPQVHYPDNIAGRASGLKGWNELKIHPGFYASAALDFEFGKAPDRLKIVEAGTGVDVFPKAIPIMAFTESPRFFFSFFIRFLFGRKWNK
jgi:hypothetical protein